MEVKSLYLHDRTLVPMYGQKRHLGHVILKIYITLIAWNLALALSGQVMKEIVDLKPVFSTRTGTDNTLGCLFCRQRQITL